MYDEGNILHFTPFYFKNGQRSKSKFFTILKSSTRGTILVSLPTSKDSIPNFIDIQSGCIESPEINLTCFVFKAGEIITDCGKSFSKNTFIHGYQIDEYEISMLDGIYKLEGVDYTIWGKLSKNIYTSLIDCLLNSNSVKRKFIRMLNP